MPGAARKGAWPARCSGPPHQGRPHRHRHTKLGYSSALTRLSQPHYSELHLVCAVQIGPKPAAPPGVIVKYKHGHGAQPTIAGARPGGTTAAPLRALDPALNLYRVQAPAGQTAAQAAAALARSSGARGRGGSGELGDGGWSRCSA